MQQAAERAFSEVIRRLKPDDLESGDLLEPIAFEASSLIASDIVRLRRQQQAMNR
jgi:hypothetical protein